ncbi:unnamed protein product [Larinioides sclopetarius]|uniref:Uncharacterized protein n=1 Tax=Larinioides sclopetarius TaxID=280406 RepID=A0AAV2AA05_9ARAC
MTHELAAPVSVIFQYLYRVNWLVIHQLAEVSFHYIFSMSNLRTNFSKISKKQK